ncbi:MAG: protein kinase, partial [Bryobacterales bacterium]|nr:protein kinase [Bryobacterales bacterium]
MAVSIRCPNPQCGGSYDVRESDLGRSFRCSRCGQKFRVSAASCATARPGTTSETAKVGAPRSPEGSPQKLGRFEIRSRLGAGAFGAVYRAYDPVLDREVALKVPHAGTLQTDQDKARFLQEAKAAGKLRHPNIVPVYDAGAEGDQYFIAAAFIEGETLEHRIECRRPKLAQTVEIVIRLAEALDYAHRSGIVHRDIKPANTMLDAVGEPLLMDFGLARFEEHQSKLTQDGTVMGTPLYMPPEQAAGQHALVGPASDQYSLGVVLYELICGQTPFSGPPGLVISLVLHEEPPRPRSVDPRIPKDLETICLKAMSKDRQHRYESCGAMAEELRRFRAGEPILARPIGPAERLWRWCRRNPVIATLSATAALLLLAVAIVTTVGHIRTSRALATAERHRRSAEQSAAQEAMERQRTEVERRRAEQAAAKEAEASELAKAKQKEAEEAAAKEAEASELAKAKQKE